MLKKWITFDLDETVMQNPFKEWVFPEIVSIVEKKVKDKNDVFSLIVEEHLQRMSDAKFLEAYDWDQIINELLVKLDVNTEIDVTSLVKKHANSPKVYLLEDTMLASLRKIKENGYHLAAATNGYHKYQYPVLQELRLDTVFDEIIASDTAGFAKPDPRMLQGLHQHDNTVIAHVGDRIDHDIVMANQLGVISIFINNALSEDILHMPIEQRRNHPSFLSICETKWHKENKLRKDPFIQKDCLPDIVVCSIEELAMHIDAIEKN